MPTLADKLSLVERGDKVVLSGYPEDSGSEWHVNSAEHITKGPTRRVAIILQAIDGSDEWLTISLERTGEEWEIDEFASFDQATPTRGDGEEATPVDPEAVELVDIE